MRNNTPGCPWPPVCVYALPDLHSNLRLGCLAESLLCTSRVDVSATGPVGGLSHTQSHITITYAHHIHTDTLIHAHTAHSHTPHLHTHTRLSHTPHSHTHSFTYTSIPITVKHTLTHIYTERLPHSCTHPHHIHIHTTLTHTHTAHSHRHTLTFKDKAW